MDSHQQAINKKHQSVSADSQPDHQSFVCQLNDRTNIIDPDAYQIQEIDAELKNSGSFKERLQRLDEVAPIVSDYFANALDHPGQTFMDSIENQKVYKHQIQVSKANQFVFDQKPIKESGIR